MTRLSADFEAEIRPLLDALAAALQQPPYDTRLDDSAPRARVRQAEVSVPVRYEVHWRRFHTVPTDLVREAAYDAKRAADTGVDEAECLLFAEVFVRDHVLNAD